MSVLTFVFLPFTISSPFLIIFFIVSKHALMQSARFHFSDICSYTA